MPPTKKGKTLPKKRSKGAPTNTRQRKTDAADDALLDAAESAATAAAAAAAAETHQASKTIVTTTTKPDRTVVLRHDHLPATDDAKPVDQELIRSHGQCTAMVQLFANQRVGVVAWLRRSYFAARIGLHGDAFCDFNRLAVIHKRDIPFPPDLPQDAAIALVRSCAAVAKFEWAVWLSTLFTEMYRLTVEQQQSLTTYIDECKRAAATNGLGTVHRPLLCVPVLLRDRSAERFSAAALSRINAHVATLSTVIEVRRSPIGGLGLFATCDLKPGEVLLLESAMFVGSDPHTTCDRCGLGLRDTGVGVTCRKCNATRFCSDGCLERATNDYHAVVCGISTEGLESFVSPGKTRLKYQWLMMRKMFAQALQRRGGGALRVRPADDAPLCDFHRQQDPAPEDDGKLSGNMWTALTFCTALEEIWASLPPDATSDPFIDFTAIVQLAQLIVVNTFAGNGDNASHLLRAANYFNHADVPNVDATSSPSEEFIFTAKTSIKSGDEVFITYTGLPSATIDQRLQYGFPL